MKNITLFNQEEVTELFNRKQIPTHLIERAKNLNAALTPSSEISDNIVRPDKRSVAKDFKNITGISLDYDNTDTLELTLFKAALLQDQEKLTNILNYTELEEEMRAVALSESVAFAFAFRDTEVIKFLLENDVEIINLIHYSNKGFESYFTPIRPVLWGFCNQDFFDEELINLLFDNGLDLNKKYSGSSVYQTIIEAPSTEEFSIKMLDQINNINELKYERVTFYYCEDREKLVLLTSFLLSAMLSKKYVLAKALIDKGADINIAKGRISTSFEYNEQESVLNIAVENNETDLVKHLLNASYDLKKGDMNLLSTSLVNENYEIFELLLRNGYSITGDIFIDVIKTSPEEFAIKVLNISNIGVNKESIDCGMRDSYNHNMEVSYLYLALINQKFELAKDLIRIGSDVNNVVDGTTAIHMATEADNIDMVEFLLDNMADPTYKEEHNTKPFINCFEKALYNNNIELIDLFLRCSDSPQNLLDVTLVSAIYKQNIAAINLLIDLGCNVNTPKNPSLVIASARGSVEICEMLIAAGADLELQCETWKVTPLHEAVNQGNTEICKLLLNNGANAKFLDKNNKTLLLKTIFNKETEIFELLIKHVADINQYPEAGRGIHLNYQCHHEWIKAIIETGKVNIDNMNVGSIELCNEIKFLLLFEENAHKALSRISLSYENENPEFLWDNSVNNILRYFLRDSIDSINQVATEEYKHLVTEMSKKVIQELKIYVVDFWIQIKAEIANFDADDPMKGSETIECPNEVLCIIGEYVFEQYCQEVM